MLDPVLGREERQTPLGCVGDQWYDVHPPLPRTCVLSKRLLPLPLSQLSYPGLALMRGPKEALGCHLRSCGQRVGRAKISLLLSTPKYSLNPHRVQGFGGALLQSARPRAAPCPPGMNGLADAGSL